MLKIFKKEQKFYKIETDSVSGDDSQDGGSPIIGAFAFFANFANRIMRRRGNLTGCD